MNGQSTAQNEEPVVFCDSFEGHEACVSGLVMYNGTLFSAGMDEHIYSWSPKDGSRLQSLEGHTDAVHCAMLHGDILITGSDDKTIRFWDLRTSECIHVLRGHSDGVNAVAVRGKQLFSASDDTTVKIWDLETFEETHSLQGHLDWASGIAFWREFMISCSDDGTLRVWDLESYECKEVIPVASHDLADEADTPHYLTVDGDNLYVAVGPHILVWAIKEGPELVPTIACKDHTDDVRMVIVNAPAGSIYSCADDGTVKVWAKETGQHVNTFEGHTDEVFCLCLSGNNLYSGAQGGQILRWQLMA